MPRRDSDPPAPRRHVPNDFDLKTSLREWCTCPQCFLVWEHPETTNDRADWEWVKARYGGLVTCDACGTISEPIPRSQKHGLAKLLGNDMRCVVKGPPAGQPLTDRILPTEEREP